MAPIAALATLVPARTITVPRPLAVAELQAIVATTSASFGPPSPAGPDLALILAAIWITGALIALAHLIWRQALFGRAARAGRAGPAVVGVLRPHIVLPRDFAARYTPREQQVILAHEVTHIARHDSRINAAVALARCLGWFNPALHLLAHHLRIDQEFACDAQVVAAHPAVRRSYAEAMLKTQLAAQPLPLGCYWPSPSRHPLAVRIDLLSHSAPGLAGRRAGAALTGLLALAAAGLAWASKPPQLVMAPAPARPEASGALAPTPAATQPGPGALKVLASASPAPTRPAAGRSAAARAVTPTVPAVTPLAETPAALPLDAIDGRNADGAAARLMPPGLFGPARRFHTAADWSRVEPGSAVRVLATMTDPDGVLLTTDLTAFGSQSWYRVGMVRRGDSHFKLFTSVAQNGDRLRVTAALDRSFQPLDSASLDLASGQTGTIRLPNGLLVTVTPTLRPETPDEIAAAQRGHGRPFVNVERVEGL
jgi:beta-lactamase regulating signal transducer with metallopeptidase domain